MADVSHKESPSSEKASFTQQQTSDAPAAPRLDLSKENSEGLLVNALSGISQDQLFRDVDQFLQEKQIQEDPALFHRAALAAQEPARFESIDGLQEDERSALQKELTSRWAAPWTLYLTILACSIGAATQGWDQTGSNGANLSFPAEFGIDGTDRGEWIVGVVNSAPYLASAALGCWLSDPLNNMFGRRGTIFITALILIATPIASGFTHSWQTLFVVRLILGIGMGAKGSTVPIFAAENSPNAIRGALTMSWQLWTAFGIFAGFVANLVVADTGRIAWRLQLGSAFIPAVPLAFLIWLCPESPRWLMKKGRYTAAYQALQRLRFTKLQAARDLYYIHVQLEEEKRVIRGATFVSRFTELFTIPRVRMATIAASTVMLAQQMCGINVMAFYSSTVFKTAGLSDREALKSSVGFGALNFVGAIPAIFVIDKFGRRSLLLTTFPIMAIFLFAAGLMFLAPNTANPDFGIVPDADQFIATKGKLAGIAIFIYLFTLAYSIGEGPVPFAYSAEVFPLAQREQGMGWAVATCLFWASVLSITFPRMLHVFGSLGTFFFYGGLNLIAFVLIFFFVPETKRLSLEELDGVFSVGNSRFASYQLTKTLPYAIKVATLQHPEKPVPLFKKVNVDILEQA
ncbi:hypothetical protein IE81DRAFT_137327 [Ceraceosorus guamensis]|uniref:Major facilitator superfamily (MFS) profile domain-containing protein n=1 Tax=Ceraceosorus guamensis TaxID=1522189 RepID=A0A316VXE9_9BASI|nr:hypothetical protein IE81DRAFT_137327 [Ceraceosorus guamensis]PWN42296.1 hypothetical protein IE81DRAFT_137327 [Ceraceosorus guamensis]